MTDAPAVRECVHLSEVLSFMNTWPSSRDPSLTRIFLSTPVQYCRPSRRLTFHPDSPAFQRLNIVHGQPYGRLTR
jgi:hypothetical protein